MHDSTVQVEFEEAEHGPKKKWFKRMCICLGPLKKGFKDGCKPIIGLDGCHLNGAYGGQLLSAVGVDCNDGMYHIISWAIVEAENTDSWN